MAISAISVTNSSDISDVDTNRPFEMDIQITDDAGGADREIVITGESDTVVATPAEIISSTLGSVSDGTISDLYIPTDTKILNLSVLVDFQNTMRGENENVVWVVTGNSIEETATIDFADDWDATGGYDKTQLSYGPGVLYVDGKNVGLIPEDGITFSRILEVAKVLGGSVLGTVGHIITGTDFRIKSMLRQMTLANLQWAWGLQDAPRRSTTLYVEGGTAQTGVYLDLKPYDPGLMPTHNVKVQIPFRADGKDLWIELYQAALVAGGDAVIKNEPEVMYPIEFEGEVSIGTDGKPIAGRVYLLDAA